MNLWSPEYAVLIALVTIAVTMLRSPRAQKVALLLASAYFYATWDYAATALLLALGCAAWLAPLVLDRTRSRVARKTVMGLYVLAAVAVLGAFKYCDFFLSSLGISSEGKPGLLTLLVPVGISFITFQTLSYVVDVYRGTTARRSLLDVLLLVSFFPHIVAGPLVRAGNFLDQFETRLAPSVAGIEAGITMFIFGAMKKVLVADSLGMFVDKVYSDPAAWSVATVWLAVLAYALQIYFDFSGYSDMAIGSARCLGVTLPDNFKQPYLSGNVTAFWRRWHVTLSIWLRDYVYVSLGGNRMGLARQNLNLLMTMAVGGLWHGASWNFVLWGVLHGVALVVHKTWSSWRKSGLSPSVTGHPAYRFGAWLLTFTFVMLAWVPFRAVDLASTSAILARLLGMGAAGATMLWVPTSMRVLLAVVGAYLALRMCARRLPVPRLLSFRGALLAVLAIGVIIVFAPVEPTPFVYAGF